MIPDYRTIPMGQRQAQLRKDSRGCVLFFALVLLVVLLVVLEVVLQVRAATGTSSRKSGARKTGTPRIVSENLSRAAGNGEVGGAS